MKRYIIYDKETGEILHTHQAFKLGSDELEKVPDEEIKRMVSRIVEPERVKVTITDEPIRSSYNFARKVDLKTGKVVTTELPPDFWIKKAKEKHQLLEATKGGN